VETLAVGSRSWEAKPSRVICDTLSGIIVKMKSPEALVREMRIAAGLSQRDLARRAATSQPAIARYEGGAAVPSWETLRRIAAACGRQLKVDAEVIPEAHDVELAESMLELTPLERLRSLRRYARLRELTGRRR
jgi:transcriptional regulator with XRE-family HTH domain